ncbi:MAG: hypothetical protein Q9170_006173 [Blastenia crenularia]
MSRYPSLQLHPGRGLGFLILGASLHDVLTRLKAQPHLYPTIDVSYSPSQPLVAPIVLNLPANGFRLRFDGPDQRLRLIEILDFGKTQLSYKNIDVVKLSEEKNSASGGPGQANQQGPPFRHIYNRLMGPTFPGEYLPPTDSTDSRAGLYVLSYPGIAFTFPLQHAAWSPKADFVSLLSSNAAESTKSLAIFNGASWYEARQDLFARPCLNPRSLALSMKGKEHQPDEIELANVCGGGVVELLRRTSYPFRIVLGETTPQDLVTELGPPDAIYRKNDHRLSIHKTRSRDQRASHGSYGASPVRTEDLFDADHSSAHTTTDDSDVEDDNGPGDDDLGHSTAKCFYNYFHHGFDVFISYPSNPSPPFPHTNQTSHPLTRSKTVDHLVATKVLLHGNVPGSYPFNRYRRSRWVIDGEAAGTFESLDSETSFTTLSEELRSVWKGNYVSEQAEKATQNAIVLDRDWGDSPGSSYEVLEGWEDSAQTHKKGHSAQEGSGSGTTQIYGFPGMLFEVLKNDTPAGLPEEPARGWRQMAAPASGASGEETYNNDAHQPCPEQMPSPASKLLPKSWTSTIQLPQTKFPPRALLAERPELLTRCTKNLYYWQSSRPPPLDPFVLHDGPPFANGPLHIGHALNKILKDITCRFELTLGKRINYVPGWDCHGLPIEIKAIEQLLQRQGGEDGVFQDGTIKSLEIRKAARQLADDAFSAQKKSFQEWGIMADWDNAWKTMDRDFELRQLSVFSSMVKKGLISRKHKPVYWSPSSRTALAEAELEYRDDHESTAAYVFYPVRLFRPNLGLAIKAKLVIWTTTPWTLPANRAIAVNSDLEYSFIDTSEYGRLIIASSILEGPKNFLAVDFRVVDRVYGTELLGSSRYADILFGSRAYDRPILHAPFVSDKTGTGLVHIAPGHGMDDYDLCQRNGIETIVPVDDAGRYTNDVPRLWTEELSGKSVLTEGNEVIMKLLSVSGLLMKQHKIIHKYPYDWRSKQPVIIRATEQWFADVGKIQGAALNALATVAFIPDTARARLKSFVKTRSEWCISRQRAWGVPIPALYSKTDGKATLTGDSVDHIISEIASRGMTAWWSDPEDDPRWVAPSVSREYGHNRFRRGTDTMDVWFDSGTSWTNMSGPAHVYLEGTDQHRGWFQSSLLTYIAHNSTFGPSRPAPGAPFMNLITHGFVLDSAGLKMSKSIGNVISPDEIMAGTLLPPDKKGRRDAMGPDALRLWVASSDYTSDVRVFPEVLQTIQKSLAKYRMTFRWILGVLRDFKGPVRLPKGNMKIHHRLALVQLRDVFFFVHDSYEERNYSRAVSELNRYVTQDLSAFYIGIVKDTLYADADGEDDRWQAQVTLLFIYQCLQIMLGPVTPLLVEETWQYSSDFMKKSSDHPLRTSWTRHTQGLEEVYDGELAGVGKAFKAARAAINSAAERARELKCMGDRLECSALLRTEKVEGVDAVTDVFRTHGVDLAGLLGVSQAEIHVGSLPLYVKSARWTFSDEFEIEGTKVVAHIYPPKRAKCVRCWRYLAPVEDPVDEALCGRCEPIVEELRHSRPDLFEYGPGDQSAG